VSVSLLRPLEDALDCFAAVTLIAGAAERWQKGDLKPSDAAKLWVGRSRIKPITGESVSDYRRRLRTTFNPFSHCSPEVVEWDVFVQRQSEKEHWIRTKINHGNRVIMLNAARIDAFLAAHTWEILAVIELAYPQYLEAQPQARQHIDTLKAEIQALLSEHWAKGLLNTIHPPELEQIPRSTMQPGPEATFQVGGSWEGQWYCGGAQPESGILKVRETERILSGTLETETFLDGRSYEITEEFLGAVYPERVFIDGFSAIVRPEPSDLRFCYDTFELAPSAAGETLEGKHSCARGSGSAIFKRSRATVM